MLEEAAFTSEMLVNFNQIRGCHRNKDLQFHVDLGNDGDVTVSGSPERIEENTNQQTLAKCHRP
jgi:hypothetical protein